MSDYSSCRKCGHEGYEIYGGDCCYECEKNELKAQLKEANEVIDFYAEKRNLGTITKEISDIYWLENGEKAREYKEKYKGKQ